MTGVLLITGGSRGDGVARGGFIVGHR